MKNQRERFYYDKLSPKYTFINILSEVFTQKNVTDANAFMSEDQRADDV